MLKKFILCAVAAVSAFSTTARGQCSSWDTIQDIAVAMAPNPIVIDAVLDNNETFNLYVDLFTGDVAAFTDSTGVGPSSGWTEDEFGTGTMTSTDLSLVFECDGSGGLLVTVSGTGFSPETFGVTSAGMLALDYRQAVNGGSAPGGKIYCTVPCPAGTWTSNSQCYSGQTCCGYVDCNSVLGPGSGTSNMNCCGSSQVCQGSPRSRHCVAVTP